MKSVAIIGSGFSSIAAACFLAKEGWAVTVIEKNSMAGGRAQVYQEDGFTFDMGPSWYWMPDVFEKFYNNFGYTTTDFYKLKRLNPSYTVVWSNKEEWKIPATSKALGEFLNQYEEGASKKLELFLKQAGTKYSIGMNDLVTKPGMSVLEFFNRDFIKGIFNLDVFTSMKKHVAKYFRNKKIQLLMEFPVLFLGASSDKIPALYSLMNYADIELGTWYPMGGMHQPVKAMQRIAEELGVKFCFNESVKELIVEDKKITHVITTSNILKADTVISGADYHFTESMLPIEKRSYTSQYWNSRVMAPSCILFYIGLNKKLPENITHHTLFFDTDFQQHSNEIYDNPTMPTDPLFYMCCPSKTDHTVAPEGGENLFLLIPVAAGLTNDTEIVREQYFHKMADRIQSRYGVDIRDSIVHKKSFSVSNFISTYNAFKGNAYGLANTLMQTSILKPKIKSKKISNLYYTGQLSVPGPGVPPALISGELVAKYVMKESNN